MPRSASTRTQAAPARQNLFSRPNDLSHAAWTKINTTISVDADAGPSASVLLDPFGLWSDVSTLPLDGIIPAAGAGIQAIVLQIGYDSPTGANYRRYVMSCIYKAGSLANYGFLMTPDGGGSGVYFSLGGAVGTTGIGYTASVTNLGGGYFRAIAMLPSQNVTCNANIYIADVDGIPTTSLGDGSSVALFAGGFQITNSNRAGPLTMSGTPLAPGIRSTP